MQLDLGGARRTPQRRKRILVVDDDPSVRECMQDVLDAAGYEIITASNGREALERLACDDPPGLILLDLMMPIMTGAEFLLARRGSDTLLRIPVVIVSAWPKEASKAEGVQGFLQKPVGLDALLDVVATHCAA